MPEMVSHVAAGHRPMQKAVIEESWLIRAHDYPDKLVTIGTVRVLSASTVRVAQVVRCADVLELAWEWLAFGTPIRPHILHRHNRRHSLPNNQLSFYSWISQFFVQSKCHTSQGIRYTKSMMAQLTQTAEEKCTILNSIRNKIYQINDGTTYINRLGKIVWKLFVQ